MGTHDVARWLVSPLDLKQRGVALSGLALIGLSYCILAELAGSGRADLGVATAWGLLTTLPWLVAFEAVKTQFLHERAIRSRFFIGAMLTAFCATVAGQFLLEFAVLVEPRSVTSVAVSRMPAAVVFCILTMPLMSDTSRVLADQGEPMVADLHRLGRADVISGAGNYADARIEARSCLIRLPLHRVEAILIKSHIRIHRSTIVKVKAIAAIGEGGFEVELHDGRRHRIGDKFLPDLRARLGMQALRSN